jgi:phosphohistidine phosphatase
MPLWKDAMVSEQGDVFRLYLLRHARAAWASPGERNFDRALDATGLAEIRSVALQAYTGGFLPDQIISSPARRCTETTAAFLEIFGNLVVGYDEQLYSGGLDAYVENIRRYHGVRSLMLVGHNPMIESLSILLAREGQIVAALPHGYPTAGLLVLDFHQPVTGPLKHRGELAALLTPALT